MPDEKPTGTSQREAPASRKMKPERIQGFLAARPAWTPGDGGRTLCRSYVLTSFAAAMAFARFVAEVSREVDGAPRLEISGAEVKITLGSEATGISDRDLELAEAINRVG